MPFYNQDLRTSQQALSTYPDNPVAISSYKVNPVAQFALRTHVDAALRFGQPQGRLSSDKHQFFSPLTSVVEPPSTIPKKAQASSRIARPSNAFMLFRSEFVKQHKHIGRRQQELSIMAACAWRALGTEGQTGWYEKAALAKDSYDTKNAELKATRQRQKPYLPRANARDVVQSETLRTVRETYSTLGPAPSARRRARKTLDDSISPLPPSARDSVPPLRSSTIMSSSALAHALHPPSFFAGHYRHSSPKITNTSPTSSNQSDSPYGGSNLHLWTSAIEMGRFNYVVSAPIPTAASTAPLSLYDSLSPHNVATFPSPAEYPCPGSPSAWSNGFAEPHYNLPDVLSTPAASYRSVYDENTSQHDHFRRRFF